MGREFDGILRQSFLVDPTGKIAKVYSKVKPEGHAKEVLLDVEALKKGTPPAAAKAPAKTLAAKKTAKKAPTTARGAPRARDSKPKR
jgi:hypothetical protein